MYAKPVGSTAFTNPEKVKTIPKNNRKVVFNIFIIIMCLYFTQENSTISEPPDMLV